MKKLLGLSLAIVMVMSSIAAFASEEPKLKGEELPPENVVLETVDQNDEEFTVQITSVQDPDTPVDPETAESLAEDVETLLVAPAPDGTEETAEAPADGATDEVKETELDAVPAPVLDAPKPFPVKKLVGACLLAFACGAIITYFSHKGQREKAERNKEK